jgi:hypothetical protein
LLLTAAVTAGAILLMWYLAERDWLEAVAEADRLDPGWRFEDLQARRASIPDEANAALRVLAAHKLLPGTWPPLGTATGLALEKSLSDLPPTAALSPQQVRALSEALAAAKAALAEARKLKDCPAGRFPPTGVQRVPTGDGAYIPEARRVAPLLIYDALLREQAGDADGALESCRALVNLARSFGDEPDPLCVAFRVTMRSVACRQIERTLARVRPSAAALAELQRLLEDEEAQPLFLMGARALRAWLHRVMEALAEGETKVDAFPGWVTAGLAVNARPVTLRVSTRIVEIAKLPVGQQEAELRSRGLPKPEEGSIFVREYIFPKIQKVATDLAHGQVRTQAELRCAIVALAAERYRLARGAWPESPDALVPAYLHAVPADPYDGQPVRYRRLADGVVIYCIGPDGNDDLGNLDRTGLGPAGTDVGLQLWDVEHRTAPEP